MKCSLFLLLAAFLGSSANASDLKWSGSTGWIYNQKTEDDSLSAKETAAGAANGKDKSKLKTKSHNMRAQLGVNGSWSNIEIGAGLRTSSGVANNDQITFTNNGDKTIALEQAWFRYNHEFSALKTSITAGRQIPIFSFDNNSENFFDNDLRLDGLGWNFSSGNFGFNAGQYVTGGRSSSTAANGNGGSTHSGTEATSHVPTTPDRFFMLFGFQPYGKFKFSDEIETKLALGYYSWTDDSNSNQTSGGTNLTNNNATSSAVIIPSVAYKVHNLRQWQIYNSWSLPYDLSISGEYVIANKANYDNSHVAGYPGTGIPTPEANNKAWAAGLAYGGAASFEGNKLTASYYYGKKGIASVIGAYSGDAILPDNKSHTVKVNYALAKGLVVGAVAMWLKEDARINANGGSATGNTYANANANQELKTNYWELNANLFF